MNPDPGADTIGRRVAYWRRQRGLTQQQLADAIGKSKSWVDKVERGIRSLDRVSVLLDLSVGLGIDITDITGALKTPPPPVTKPRRRVRRPEILRLHRAGWRATVIAKHTGVHIVTVYQAIAAARRALELEPVSDKWRRLYSSGLTLREIAEQFDTDSKTVWSAIHEHVPTRPRGPRENAEVNTSEIVALRETGLSYDAIAARVGMSRSAVRRRHLSARAEVTSVRSTTFD